MFYMESYDLECPDCGGHGKKKIKFSKLIAKFDVGLFRKTKPFVEDCDFCEGGGVIKLKKAKKHIKGNLKQKQD